MSKGRASFNEEGVSLQMERLWRPVFDKYDTDRDGIIKCCEFKRILKDGNTHLSEDIPNEVLEEIIEMSCDDGSLTFDDFLKMIHARDLGSQRPRLQRLIRYAAMAVVPKTQRQSTIRRYIEEYNCFPPPIFLLGISIIEVAIFIYYCIVYGQFSAIEPVPWKSIWIYNPCKRNEAWRFVTYMFIHAGFVHMFFNVLIQLILGIPLEMVHKWWRVLLVYVAGVAAGSLGASLSDPHSYLAGASGGVYALIAAHLSNIIINWKEMEFRWVQLIAILLFSGTDIGVAIYGRYVKNESSRTSYAAHIAGAIAGFLMGVNVLRNLRVYKWETILGWFLLVVYMLLMAFAVIFNIVNEEHFRDPLHPNKCRNQEF